MEKGMEQGLEEELKERDEERRTHLILIQNTRKDGGRVEVGVAEAFDCTTKYCVSVRLRY